MIIAVDTGGTKTLVARFLHDDSIDASERFLTPKSQTDYLSSLISSLHTMIGDEELDDVTIVIALPGIVSGGIALWCNNLGWVNFDVARPLREAFPGAVIIVENDANLGGVGEVRRMAALPRSALYVTISTGIGTGVIEYGKIDESLSLSEGGRSLVEFHGKVQEWEAFSSGGAIKRAYGLYARDITEPQIWDEIADRISRGFLAIIPFLQPDVVIIGGSIGTYFDRYSSALISLLTSHLPQHIPCPTFIAAHAPEEAVIYGCYHHAIDTRARR